MWRAKEAAGDKGGEGRERRREEGRESHTGRSAESKDVRKILADSSQARTLNSSRLVRNLQRPAIGFTGHIPNLRGAYGVTYETALGGACNTVPPLSPMVHIAWSQG
jgi:hypothetical protein